MDIDIKSAFAEVREREWTVDNFRFYTAVSVMSSSRIEGEQLEVDSYVKHKILNVEYLPNLTEKPNDLYLAYEFARDNALTLENFFKAHTVATSHLLPASQRGIVRSGNMVIMEQQTNKIQYEAAPANIVKRELIKPSYKAFEDNNLWSFYNHVTNSLREAHPLNYISQHVNFHNFIETEFELA